MIGAEIFLPGGILGALGGVALLGAMISGFIVFGPAVGVLVSLAILALLVATVVVWMRFFPKTPLGRAMTLAKNEKAFTAAADNYRDLIGREGKTLSDLRPAGIALIDGRRVDVVSDGGMISSSAPVKVIDAQGGRVIVRQISPDVGPGPEGRAGGCDR